jgi:DNA-binding CsgD family transcriptional regulator
MRLGIRWEHGRSPGDSSPRDSKISGADALLLLEIIEECLSSGTEQSLREKVFPSIQKLIPFDFGAAALGGYTGRGGALAFKRDFRISVPAEFSTEYARKNLVFVDEGAIYNFQKYEPQYWSVMRGASIGCDSAPPPVLSLLMDFGMTSGYSHGIEMPTPGEGGSYCNFLGASAKYDPRTFEIMEHLMPHLHLALLRAASHESRSAEGALSVREREVLNWLKEGKSSWEISVVLGVSERTINFHVYNLLGKLGAMNRLQAIAIAVRRGLIPVD